MTSPPASESGRIPAAGSGTGAPAGPGAAGASAQSAVRTWTGVLRAGVVAVGAETTGVTLTTDTDVYELRAAGALLQSLLKLDGQRITVQGTLTESAGVEVRRRRIVDVAAIVAR